MDRPLAIVLCLIFASMLFILCTSKPSETINATGVQCGGWDTYGDVICECKGNLEKPPCPENASCDSGAYICYGTCGVCTCYQGSVDLDRHITCGGRNVYSGKRSATD